LHEGFYVGSAECITRGHIKRDLNAQMSVINTDIAQIKRYLYSTIKKRVNGVIKRCTYCGGSPSGL
jgi:hypothetical protein